MVISLYCTCGHYIGFFNSEKFSDEYRAQQTIEPCAVCYGRVKRDSYKSGYEDSTKDALENINRLFGYEPGVAGVAKEVADA